VRFIVVQRGVAYVQPRQCSPEGRNAVEHRKSVIQFLFGKIDELFIFDNSNLNKLNASATLTV
jgi:hypothetical protein